MNSSLKILDQQTDAMLKKIKTGFIVRWAHSGFSDFLLESVEMINYDIHLFEENNEAYDTKTQRGTILQNLNAILNDTKNLLMLKEVNEEVNYLLNDYLILVNNWNQLVPIEAIEEDIQIIMRIFSIQNTLEGLLERANVAIRTLQELADKTAENRNSIYTFKTSSTYLQAIKDSLNRDKKIEPQKQEAKIICE